MGATGQLGPKKRRMGGQGVAVATEIEYRLPNLKLPRRTSGKKEGLFACIHWRKGTSAG